MRGVSLGVHHQSLRLLVEVDTHAPPYPIPLSWGAGTLVVKELLDGAPRLLHRGVATLGARVLGEWVAMLLRQWIEPLRKECLQ